MLVILEIAAPDTVEHEQNLCEQVSALENGNIATSSNSGKRFSFQYCYYIGILFCKFKSLYNNRQKTTIFKIAKQFKHSFLFKLIIEILYICTNFGIFFIIFNEYFSWSLKQRCKCG